MNKKAVIISGGSLDTSFARSVLDHVQPEILIGVDRGLFFFHANGILPTHVVGDFDSIDQGILPFYREHPEIEVRAYNPVKDATDTEIALRLAVELQAEEVILLGGTGTRLDHVLGNIQCLKILQDAGVKGWILDAHNRISLLEKKTILRKEDAFGKYLSFFSLGGAVEHFSLEGARYPLTDHTLSPYDSLCVSNEYADEKVSIHFLEGTVVLVESRD